MNWFRKLLHMLDEPCVGCGEVRLPFWKAYCSYCEPGDKP